MFGLTGFANFIVTLLIVIIILLPLIWLFLPQIFKYVVCKYFDGSYDYKKDKLKIEGSLSDQDKSFEVIMSFG